MRQELAKVLVRSVPYPGVHVGPVSFSIRLAGIYYFFIFALWPLVQDVLGLDESTSRVPLVLGLSMLLAAVMSSARKLNRGLLLMGGVFFAMFMSTSVSSLDQMVGSFEELLRQFGLAISIFLATKTLQDCRFLIQTAAGTALFNAAYGALFVLPPLASIGGALLNLGFPSGIDHVATRMIGASSDPNYFGLLLVPGLLYLLSEALSRNKLISVHAAGTAFLLLCLMLSFSRTAWVASLVGVLILLWNNQRNAAKTLLVTAPMMVLAITYGLRDFLEVAISDNEARATLVLGNQVDSRTWIWKAYWDLAMDQPFGYGPGSVESLRMTATVSFLEGSTARPHNIYLILLIERGVQSVLPLLLIIFSGLRISYLISRSTAGRVIGEFQPVAAIVVASAVGIFSLGGMMQIPLMFVALAHTLERILHSNVLQPEELFPMGIVSR